MGEWSSSRRHEVAGKQGKEGEKTLSWPVEGKIVTKRKSSRCAPDEKTLIC